MNSTTSSLRSSCSCCAIGASLHVLCGNVSCHAAVRNVDPVRSVISAGLSHANITSYARLHNKYSKTACVGQCYFPIDTRLWNCDTRRSRRAESNMVFSGTQPIERVTKDRAPMKVNVLALIRLTRRHRVYFILLCGQTTSRAQLGLCTLSSEAKLTTGVN